MRDETSNAQHPFRVAIVGAGNQGADHAAAYRRLADSGVEIAAVVDVDHDRAASFAAQHAPGAGAYADTEAMLDDVRPDAVSICVPNKFHSPVTMAALEARAHVLCEKPPALTAREAHEMQLLAENRGLVLTYGLLYREMYEYLLPFVAELGDIYYATALWVRLRGIPGWGIYGNRELQGGGAGIDLGVHVYDLAWWLMGRPPARLVSARTFDQKAHSSRVGLLGPWNPDTFEVETHAVATVDFDSSRLQLEATFAADVPDEELAHVALQGRNGRLIFRLMTGQPGPDPACAPRLYTERNGRLVEQIVHQPLPMTSLDACTAQVTRFVKACRDSGELLVPARDGTAVQAVIGGIYRSAELHGEQVRIL